jgi:hypothetical protein
MKAYLLEHKAFEKAFDIKFCKPEVRKHTNGFVSVIVNWHNQGKSPDFPKCKYINLCHWSSGGGFIVNKKRIINVAGAHFQFPDWEKVVENLDITPWFEVCLGTPHEEEADSNSYDYLFFKNLKYGVEVWFAPSGWEQWDQAVDASKGINPHDGSTLDNFLLQEERDAWKKCAEDLVDYAHEFVHQLSLWGKGYDRYDKQISQAEDAIEEFIRLKNK